MNHPAERFPYVRPPELGAAAPARRPVVIVGAGPVGLAAALDCAAHDIPALLLDDDDRVSEGSRAICFAQRTLEILDRLGCAEPLVRRGVVWNTGKVFLRDELLYAFDLMPEPGHRRPAFINLQQYHFERILLARLEQLPLVEIRWRNRVCDVRQDERGATVTVETPDGRYEAACDFLIAADGVRSPVRQALGLAMSGQVFNDHFLIADVRMEAEFPSERWFWFDPPFHRNQSALLHRQADNVWRIDFQLGRDADPEQEREPGRVRARVAAMLGPDRPFELEWVSVYKFRCMRMERFVHGRVIFAGDSAHQVSPFGARGANGGIQDVDNLVWKLRRVMDGDAPPSLLETYDIERGAATDENILHSTRSTDFITPKSDASRVFRDAVLALARDCPFARQLVNSGRLSRPAVMPVMPLNTPDEAGFQGPMRPGAACADAPLLREGRAEWLLEHLGGVFSLMCFEPAPWHAAAIAAACQGTAPGVRLIAIGGVVPDGWIRVEDPAGWVGRRYDGRPGTLYLIRPDQHVAARWRGFDSAALRQALARAAGTRSPAMSP